MRKLCSRPYAVRDRPEEGNCNVRTLQRRLGAAALALMPFLVNTTQAFADAGCYFIPVKEWEYKDGILYISVEAPCKEDFRPSGPLLYRNPSHPSDPITFGIEIPASGCTLGRGDSKFYKYTADELGLGKQFPVTSMKDVPFKPIKDKNAYLSLLREASSSGGEKWLPCDDLPTPEESSAYKDTRPGP